MYIDYCFRVHEHVQTQTFSTISLVKEFSVAPINSTCQAATARGGAHPSPAVLNADNRTATLLVGFGISHAEIAPQLPSNRRVLRRTLSDHLRALCRLPHRR